MAYNLLYPVLIVTNGDMSADITSSVTEIQQQDNIGIQLNWTGTPSGTFDVQVSMDYKEDSMGNVLNTGSWISLPLSPGIVASGSADNAYIDLNQLSASYIRIVYARTSGTGTLNAYITGKGV